MDMVTHGKKGDQELSSATAIKVWNTHTVPDEYQREMVVVRPLVRGHGRVTKGE